MSFAWFGRFNKGKSPKWIYQFNMIRIKAPVTLVCRYGQDIQNNQSIQKMDKRYEGTFHLKGDTNDK